MAGAGRRADQTRPWVGCKLPYRSGRLRHPEPSVPRANRGASARPPIWASGRRSRVNRCAPVHGLPRQHSGPGCSLQHRHRPCAGDSGLSVASPWSYWTRNKLEILAGYLPALNNAARISSQRIYLDLMAGEPENEERDTGEKFDGSPIVAMKADPPFTQLRFCELPAVADELEAALKTQFPGDSRYRIGCPSSSRRGRTLASKPNTAGPPSVTNIAPTSWQTIRKLTDCLNPDVDFTDDDRAARRGITIGKQGFDQARMSSITTEANSGGTVAR